MASGIANPDLVVAIGSGSPVLSCESCMVVNVLPTLASLHGAVAAVYERGASIAWSVLYPNGTRLPWLPRTPFERKRLWLCKD